MTGFEIREVDFSGITTVEEFHERVRQGIRVPEYYGNNLDALNDVLSDMKGRIVFLGTENIDEDMVEYMDRFRMLCEDMAANPLLEIIIA